MTPFFYGAVAQLGERRLCKADVSGSSPLSSTEHSGVESTQFFDKYIYKKKKLN